MKETTQKMTQGRSVWTINTKMFYPFYQLKDGDLPIKKYNEINKLYHDTLREHLLQGDTVKLPNRFGVIRMTQDKGIKHSYKKSSLNQRQKKREGKEIFYNKVYVFNGRDSFNLRLKLGFATKNKMTIKYSGELGKEVKKRDLEYSGK